MSTSLPPALAQLDGFVAADPANNSLLTHAFDTALGLGHWDAAQRYLRGGLAQPADPMAWRLRAAHLLMAQHDWLAAKTALDALRSTPEAPNELLQCIDQDAALIAMHERVPEQAVQVLMPWVEAGPVPMPALQALWLRALHRTAQLDVAIQSVQAWRLDGVLAPEAAGVAALIALDANDLATSRQLADDALQALPRQTEALLVRGSIALGEQNPQAAEAALLAALHNSPNDGRTLSALAFTDMLKGELAQAIQRFHQALGAMPEHVGTWLGLGWASLLAGDLDAADRAFTHAVQLDHNFAESQGAAAVIKARRGDLEAAKRGIEVALRLDAQCLSAHYARAILEGKDQDGAYLRRVVARVRPGLWTGAGPNPQ